MDMETKETPIISREFIALPSFDVKWAKIGLGHDDLVRLESELLPITKAKQSCKARVVRERCGVPSQIRGRVALPA